MKKTFLELNEIDQSVSLLYKNNDKLRDTKFGYAYKKFYEKNFHKLNKKLQEELQDVRIENALEDDKTKEILKDEESFRGYKYSKEGLKLVVKSEREILSKYEAMEVEIEPYFCKKESLPELTEYQVELFKGCIIEEQ